MKKVRSADMVGDGQAQVPGFIACSTTGMPRRRDGMVFFPERHFYPGEPTPAQLADPFLRIEQGAQSGQVPTVDTGISEERQKQLQARARLQGAPTPVMREAE